MENVVSKNSCISQNRISQIKVFLCMCLANFLQNVIASINGPLYPPEAESKGLSPATYGVVLSFFRFVMLVFGPIFGVYMEKIGLKRAFVIGVFLNGISPVLFGLLDFVDSYTPYLILSLLLRGFEGFGAILFLCSMFMMSTTVFHGRVAMSFAILQTVFLVGNSIGPLLGSLLNSSFGYAAPYILFGILQMITSVLAAWTLPKDTLNTSSSISNSLRGYLEILKIPSVAIFIYACGVSGTGPEFLTAILEPNLRQFSLGKVEVGLVFCLVAFLQLVSPLWGYLIDILKKPHLFALIGSIVMVTAVVMVGPFPGINPDYGILVAGLVTFGLAQGILSVSSITNLRLSIMQNGIKESMISISFVSMGYLTATSVGATIGPLMAGVLYQEFGFQNATLFLIVGNLILGFLVLGIIFCRTSKSIARSAEYSDTSHNDAEKNLLFNRSSRMSYS